MAKCKKMDMQLNQIFVKTVSGRTIVFNIDVSLTDVDDLKMMIEHREGVPTPAQRLVYAGKMLDDGRPLSHYNIDTNVTIHLLLSLGVSD